MPKLANSPKKLRVEISIPPGRHGGAVRIEKDLAKVTDADRDLCFRLIDQALSLVCTSARNADVRKLHDNRRAAKARTETV